VPSFEKYSGARMIVENMSGAGGYVGIRYLYNTAKPDGLALGMFNPPGAFIAELMGQKEASWKLEELNYIGRISKGSGGIMMVGKQSPLRTLEDVLKAKRQIKCATIGPTEGASMYMGLAAEALDLNFKIVPGFQGGKACILAVIKGEIEMTINPPAGFEDEFKKGDLRALSIVAGKEVAPAFRSLFSSVPRLIDLPLSKDKKRFLEFADFVVDIGFVLAGPPGMPKDRVQFLENAMAKAMGEPDVRNPLVKRGDNYAPLSGTEYLKILKETKATVADIGVKNLNHILFEKYY
jgi:tripartite-type tricarboxylate transporter receptor subunit TctC